MSKIGERKFGPFGIRYAKELQYLINVKETTKGWVAEVRSIAKASNEKVGDCGPFEIEDPNDEKLKEAIRAELDSWPDHAGQVPQWID